MNKPLLGSSNQRLNSQLTPSSKSGLICRTRTGTQINFLQELNPEPEFQFHRNSSFHSIFCGTRTVLIFFKEPEPEVLHKSQEPPNTGTKLRHEANTNKNTRDTTLTIL
jgi:hypothetical protein